MSLSRRLWNVVRAHLGNPDPRSRPVPPPGADQGPRPRADAEPRVDPRLARYYANLELPYGADLAAVEKAWKRLARSYHPDRHARDPERQRIADELMKELQHAYRELRAHLEKERAA